MAYSFVSKLQNFSFQEFINLVEFLFQEFPEAVARWFRIALLSKN